MAQYRLTVTTSATASVIQGESEPVGSDDGRLRVVWSCDEMGRGVSATIEPLTADTQFVLHSVRAIVIPSAAGPDDA